MIARLDDHHYAFLVDALEDVAEHVRLPLAAGVVAGSGVGSAGLIERDGEPLPSVDFAALVPAALDVAA